MNGTLRRIEKELRNIAKRYKNIKYSKSLLLSFLVTGAFSYGNEENFKKIFETLSDDIKEIFKVVVWGEKFLIKKEDLKVAYRKTEIQDKNWLVLSATFKFDDGFDEARVKEIKELRESKKRK